jgi:hypothetical protein
VNALLLAAVALSLSLETVWGDRRLAGAESLRQDIERRIASAIVGEGCFASVLPPRSPDADVRLEVLLDDYHEEKSFDDALAAYGREGNDPAQEMRVVATFEVLVRWRLWAGASDVPFREKRFRILRELRPRFPGDDPTAYARDEAIEAIGREAARAVCKAAGPKLEAAARGR